MPNSEISNILKRTHKNLPVRDTKFGQDRCRIKRVPLCPKPACLKQKPPLCSIPCVEGVNLGVLYSICYRVSTELPFLPDAKILEGCLKSLVHIGRRGRDNESSVKPLKPP